MKWCDLHTHSVFSDGTWPPQQLLQEAQRIGLGAIALTDHNTIDGLPLFLEQARGMDVIAIPGIEFSTDYAGKDVHILGLFLRQEFYPEITRMLMESQKRKEQSNQELIENLNRAGYALDYDWIRKSGHGGQFNRAHIATEMVRLGYYTCREEAFAGVLHPDAGYYHAPKRMESAEAIAYIQSIGAVSVLAHPLLTFSKAELETFLDLHAHLGLDGMETEYSTYDEETTILARQMADQNGLLYSGGSDFHGDNKPTIRLGVGKGTLSVANALAEKLKERYELKNS